MISKISISVFAVFLCFGIFERGYFIEIEYEIYLKHPGVSLTDSIKTKLVQVKKEGERTQFYMDVKTVVCGDSQCKIDIVRLFFDELGFYSRLHLPKGVDLEKAEGAHFLKEDYEKLDRILLNKKSVLADVLKEEVTGSESTEGVDGASGATILLAYDDYVKGAVWTCYTLWHWVNGGVSADIRNISGDELSIEELQTRINSDSDSLKIFALEQVIRRKNYESKTIQSVLSQSESANHDLLKLIINFSEQAPDDVYFSNILKLINSENEKLRSMCLNALLKTGKTPPETFYLQLAKTLSNSNSYPDINRFLNFLEKKKVDSPDLNNQIIPFLQNENFLIARRAYWFLSESVLSGLHQKEVDSFFEKNKERL